MNKSCNFLEPESHIWKVVAMNTSPRVIMKIQWADACEVLPTVPVTWPCPVKPPGYSLPKIWVLKKDGRYFFVCLRRKQNAVIDNGPHLFLFWTRCENVSFPLLSMMRSLLEADTCSLELSCHQYLQWLWSGIEGITKKKTSNWEIYKHCKQVMRRRGNACGQ